MAGGNNEISFLYMKNFISQAKPQMVLLNLLSFKVLNNISKENIYKVQKNISNYIPYARHYNPRLVYFYPIFEVHFFVFKEVFSENSAFIYG